MEHLSRHVREHFTENLDDAIALLAEAFPHLSHLLLWDNADQEERDISHGVVILRNASGSGVGWRAAEQGEISSPEDWYRECVNQRDSRRSDWCVSLVYLFSP